MTPKRTIRIRATQVISYDKYVELTQEEYDDLMEKYEAAQSDFSAERDLSDEIECFLDPCVDISFGDELQDVEIDDVTEAEEEEEFSE